MSIDEVIKEISCIYVDSKDLNTKLVASQKGIAKSNENLAKLVKNNKSGEEAVKYVKDACVAMKKASEAISHFTVACNKCIKELS